MLMLYAMILIGVVMIPLSVIGGLATTPSGRGTLRGLWPGLRRWNIWHICLAMLLVAAGIALAEASPPAFIYSVVLGLVVAFAIAWSREFLFLMSLGDDAFPGRNDKLIWALLLIVAAPAGLWVFRSYRLAHWPDGKGEPDRDGVVEESTWGEVI